MELPVQPAPLPDAQNTTALPDARPATGGRFSRVTGLASRALGLDQQPTQAPAPSFEPAATPGLQPRIDTTPATGSVVPSPWANPDGAIPGTPNTEVTYGSPEPVAPPREPVAEPAAVPNPEPITPTPAPEPSGDTNPLDRTTTSTTVTAPIASPEAVVTQPLPEPVAEPAAVPNPEPITPTPAPEPVATPEPSPAIAPVWTPDASPAQPITAIEPDMRPSSTPSVEPITSAAPPEEAADAATEIAEEPPLFRKVVDGDLIRYEFTPEGRERIKGAFTKAIEEGTFDNILGPLMDRSESSKLDTSALAAADTQGSHESTPLTTTPIDTSPNSTVIPTTPATPPDWSNPGGPGPVSS